MSTHRRLDRLVILGLLVLAGCGEDFWGSKKPTTRPSGTLPDLEAMRRSVQSVAMEGTIGSVANLQGMRYMRVRGYGLVWGLNGQGSRFCPPAIRERILRDIRRFRLANPHLERNLTAEELIDSMNTAVVEVTGDVPAGAQEGTIFDVVVSAVATSPDARSLAGGHLLPCELQILQETSPGDAIEGRTHAKARGPVFTNPFIGSTTQPAADTSLLEGRVIGGGVNTLKRRLGLDTFVSSYRTVREIADAINSRFAGDPKIADPTSSSHVDLRVPDEYRGKEARFVELVMHLPLSPSPAVREMRTKTLISELSSSIEPPEDAALSLEGIGPSVITLLSPLYTHPQRQVSWYAARTGLRLGDAPALEVVARHAKDPKSPYRMQAIREMGNCHRIALAATVLRELLDSPDTWVRIRAYEALRTADRSAMVSVVVGRDPGNFILDVLPSAAPPLIYARRSEVRQIALIGANQMAFRLPLFYSKPGKQVTLSAAAGDHKLTVLRKELDRVAGEFKVPLSVVQLTRFMGDDPRMGPDKTPAGLGLDYAVVLDVLYTLCQDGALNARMEWEQQSIEDLIGPLRPTGRPESDL
ncbi:MAG: flagellar basal body P-ring protein FlgI [Phycisphaerae bacterium]